MPYHVGTDDTGQKIDFPAVYEQLIAPAIVAAGMTPLRADEDPGSSGIFHKSMFERLVVCEFAVADLSAGNANVYYELGVRHGLRPYSTVLLFRRGWRLPLDLAPNSAIEYTVTRAGLPADLPATTEKLVTKLQQARRASIDSPVYQLVTGLPVPEVDHERIDSFRSHADRDEQLRRQLDVAARGGVERVREVEAGLGQLHDLDIRSALGLVVVYRSVGAWADIVRLIQGLAAPIQSLDLLQEQYAAALNRSGDDVEAERILKRLLAKRPSSETSGLLGRVYKDRWAAATTKTRKSGLLDRAIDVYLRGFETDWRDPYPGFNAVMLMTLKQPVDPRRQYVLPVVRYAADRRLQSSDREPDYWDHATDLGLNVLTGDHQGALKALECALAVVRDAFEPQTTARDLAWVAAAMRDRGEDAVWVEEIAEELRSS